MWNKFYIRRIFLMGFLDDNFQFIKN